MKNLTFPQWIVAALASVLISGCVPTNRSRPSSWKNIFQCSTGEQMAREKVTGEYPSGRKSPIRRTAGRRITGQETMSQSVSGVQSGNDINGATDMSQLSVRTSSPLVRVVGESTPCRAFAELELLAAEIHSALACKRGLQLEDSALVTQLPQRSCAIASGPIGQRATNSMYQALESTGNPIQRVSGRMEEPSVSIASIQGHSAMSSGGLEFPLDQPMVSEPGYEVAVIVNDFTPYRPMQLTATIVVRDLHSGHELHRIHRVWRGAEHEPDFATVRKATNADLRHPATLERLEYHALPEISPRHLIKRVATEVADSLHQFVLSASKN